MPEDPQESKYRSVPIGDSVKMLGDPHRSKYSSVFGEDSVKMPEDPHLQQEEEFSFPTKRDPLDGFVFSQQRRMEGLQRFMKKRKLRAIPECSDRLIVDEMEVYEDDDDDDDDDEVTYPCPYCHAEFELLHLCDHLEEEHYDDDTAAAVCSICKHNIRGDMLRHITTEHEALFKMALQQDRLHQIPDSRSQELSLLARDLHDFHLSTQFADKGQPKSGSGMMDPLLSSLVLNYPAPGAEEISKLVTSCAEGSSSKSEPAKPIWQSSFDPSLSSEEREKKRRQAAGKAAFVQDLVCSTMFSD